MPDHHASASTQRAPTTSNPAAANAQTGGAHGGMRTQLRQASYTSGAEMLSAGLPGHMPVQKKDGDGGGLGGGGLAGLGIKPQGDLAKNATKGARVGSATAAGDKDAATKEKLKGLKHDFGLVDSMELFQAAAGKFLDGLVIGVGDEVEAELSVTVAAGVYIKVDLGAGVKRTEAGIELTGSAGLEVGVKGKLFWGISGNFGVAGKLSMTAKGDSGSECMALMGLGIYNWLLPQDFGIEDEEAAEFMRKFQKGSVSQYVCDLIWGTRFVEDVMKEMEDATAGDEADTIEMAASIGLTGGLSYESGKKGHAGHKKFEPKVSGDLEAKSTLGKGADGKLEEEKENDAKLTINVPFEMNISGWTAKVEFEAVGSANEGWELGVTVEVGGHTHKLGLDALSATLFGAYAAIIGFGINALAGQLGPKFAGQMMQFLVTLPKAGFLGACSDKHDLLPAGVESEAAVEFEAKYAGGKFEFEAALVHELKTEEEGDLGGIETSAEASVKHKTHLFSIESGGKEVGEGHGKAHGAKGGE